MNPWIVNAKFDGFWILLPGILPALLILLFPGYFQEQNDTGPWIWLLLVVGIDVAHTYSSIFRTYLDREVRQAHHRLLWQIPFIAFIASMMLYSLHPSYFWTALAYLAVFHFIRQQYGFLRLYSRFEKLTQKEQWLDQAAIYAASVYPILIWHLEGRSFNWFLEGDFLSLPDWPSWPFTLLYLAIQTLFLGYNVKRWLAGNRNLPKLLLWFSTSLSWYVGIVLFDGDLTFSLTNILAHGIPYMALVKAKERPQLRPVFKRLSVFVLIVIGLAYVEELLWNEMIWQNSSHVFFPNWNLRLPLKELGMIFVALLAVPQITHYCLDGFIWKRNFMPENPDQPGN